MPPSDRLIIHVRVTPSLLKRIKVAAAESERSMNAEIAARLERSFSAEDATRTEAMRLIAEGLALLDKGQDG
jgi:hypothetical protein